MTLHFFFWRRSIFFWELLPTWFFSLRHFKFHGCRSQVEMWPVLSRPRLPFPIFRLTCYCSDGLRWALRRAGCLPNKCLLPPLFERVRRVLRRRWRVSFHLIRLIVLLSLPLTSVSVGFIVFHRRSLFFFDSIYRLIFPCKANCTLNVYLFTLISESFLRPLVSLAVYLWFTQNWTIFNTFSPNSVEFIEKKREKLD